MSDAGSIYTDKRIKALDRRIEEVYNQARMEMEEKLEDFNRRYVHKYEIHEQELKSGKITQAQFDSWVKGQMFQRKQWQAKRDQLLQTQFNSNKIATAIINDERWDVFARNANFAGYKMESSMGVDFGFSIYDKNTVTQLIKDDPQLLPEWKIDQQKDYAWNYKRVNNAVTQGIIQGESLDKISKRLVNSLVTQNENLMKTFARTAMTGAQNAGRNARMEEAKKKGINVKKVWMATLDGRTRDSHREMDGETIKVGDKWHHYKFSNGCEYPGDPHGPASEVYNCRCTLVSEIVDYPSEYLRRDNVDGKLVKNMTYKDWYVAKYGKELKRKLPKVTETPEIVTIVDSFQSKLGQVKTIEEVNDLMNNQDWFRTKLNGDKSTVDLTGCDLSSAKSIAASYEQVFEKYPKLKGKFDAPNAQPKGMKSNTYAWCYTRSNGLVQVNPNRYNNWDALVRSYESDVNSRWHPYGTTAEGIITHEIGHAIDGLLAREGVLGGVTANYQYRLASSSLKTTIMNRAAKLDEQIALDMRMDKYWKSNSAVENNVSRYASKNAQEWFAECFVEYITSANPRVIAKEFGKELEKLVEKLK